MFSFSVEISTYLTLLNNSLFLGLWGLFVGSFLNVVVYRLPKIIEQSWGQGIIDTLKDLNGLKTVLPTNVAEDMFDTNKDKNYSIKTEVKSLSFPASHCPKCGKKISWFENIPVLSWISLKGKCSNCKTKISAQYPVVELVTALCFTAIPWAHPHFSLVQNFVFTSLAAVFISLILIDYKKQLLPDILLGWALFLTLLAYSQHWSKISLEHGLISGSICFSVLFLLSKAGQAWKGVSMMGDGDIKLVFILGMYLQPMQIPIAFTTAFAIFIAQVILSSKSNKFQKSHAFGPSLILSFLYFQTFI